MSTYSTTEVAELLGISPARVRRLARSADLDPGRTPGAPYTFGFRDLVLLRTAVALEESGVTAHRLLRSIRALGRQLPPERSLTALRITSDTGEVVAVDDELAWDVESGQTRMRLEASTDEPVTEISRRRPRRRGEERAPRPEDWYELGCALQAEDPGQAEHAFRQALEGDPELADAAVNLGWLLHERGETRAAEAEYRRALSAEPEHPTAAYNLGVALEDRGETEAAREWYLVAIDGDPLLADAYYNLSRLYERVGDRAAALRYLRSYSELVRIG
ncbi:MAG: tetratricopeptide repeat protein [Gemmatimonadota bacterium]